MLLLLVISAAFLSPPTPGAMLQLQAGLGQSYGQEGSSKAGPVLQGHVGASEKKGACECLASQSPHSAASSSPAALAKPVWFVLDFQEHEVQDRSVGISSH